MSRRVAHHRRWSRGFLSQRATGRAELDSLAGSDDDIGQLLYNAGLRLYRCNAMRSAERGPTPGSLLNAAMSAVMESGSMAEKW